MAIKQTAGKTTINLNHDHHYKVDVNGNGWAVEAYHPKSKNIYHKHEIINWVVQPAHAHVHTIHTCVCGCSAHR